MASGVAASPECLATYQELKLGKKLKYIIYGLNPIKTEVIVYKSSTSSNYEDFIADLPEDGCRWAVYDFEFDNGEGKRNKLLFYSWSPESAKVKEKMVYASSKDALRRALVGIALEIQGTETSEVDYEAVQARVK